ncbi:MAG TPA: ABC transporter permease subunit [Pseudonocardia sp.]|nr:ABC transporter permease subunit [Pseudonocardia sp.]
MLTRVDAREASLPVPPVHRAVRRPSRRRWLAGAGVVVLASVGVAVAGGIGFRPGGLGFVGSFLAAAAHPRVDAEFLALTAGAAVTTLGYALLGTVLSVALGATGGVLGSQVWWRLGRRRGALGRRGRLAWAGGRGLLVVPRGIHEVVWGLFLLSVLGIEPVVAVLAIAIPFGAITAKVFAEILDDVDPRPAQALLAAGASRAGAFCYAVVPGAVGELTSYAFYRFDCAIRSAAILGLVGVGGLGFELQLSFSALRYAEIWTLLYALIALSLAADAWGSAVRGRLAAPRPRRRRVPRRPVRAPGRLQDHPADVRCPQGHLADVTATTARPGRDPVLAGSVLAAVVAVPAAAWWIGLDLRPLVDARSWALAGELLAASWPPTLGAGPAGPGGSGSGGLTGVVVLSVATLAMSVLAIVLAIAGGLALAGPAARPSQAGDPRARRWARRGRSALVRLLLVVLRAVPPPVWALVALFVLAPGIVPGAVALGIYTAGVLGRLFAESIENLDRRPRAALRAQGASATQALLYATLPAAAPRLAAYGCYRWEVTIRETVIVGVVGAGGLGMLLQTQLALFDYGGAITTIGVLLVLTVLVDLTSAGLRRAVG